MAGWHYLAVRMRAGSESWIEIREVHGRHAGHIDSWSEKANAVRGNDVDDLVFGLSHMLRDIIRWGVIDEGALHPGLVLAARRVAAEHAAHRELSDALRSLSIDRNLAAALLERLQRRRGQRARAKPRRAGLTSG